MVVFGDVGRGIDSGPSPGEQATRTIIPTSATLFHPPGSIAPGHRARSAGAVLHRQVGSGGGASLCTVTVLRVALAQLNPTVGDLDGNLAKMIDAYDRAEAAGCDIIAFPELSTTGYPPEDLVLKPGFVADNLDRAGEAGGTNRPLRSRSSDSSIRAVTSTTPLRCARTAQIVGRYHKRLLPNTTVFDEARYFTPGDDSDPLELYVIGGVKVGISICEDIWSPFGPVAEQAAAGAELSININGSPFHAGKVGRA